METFFLPEVLVFLNNLDDKYHIGILKRPMPLMSLVTRSKIKKVMYVRLIRIELVGRVTYL